VYDIWYRNKKMVSVFPKNEKENRLLKHYEIQIKLVCEAKKNVF